MEQVIKKKALRRLQIIKGQIEGLKKMIADERTNFINKVHKIGSEG
jgi:DNA-binding FrmR family transcriptional regulator